MRRELRKAPCPLTAHSLTALLRSASSRQGPLRWSAAEAPSGRGARSGTWSLLLPGGSWLRGGSPACDVPPSSNATQREALMMSRKSARRGDRKSRHLLKKGSRERLVLCLCRRTQIGTVVREGRTWRPGRVLYMEETRVSAVERTWLANPGAGVFGAEPSPGALESAVGVGEAKPHQRQFHFLTSNLTGRLGGWGRAVRPALVSSASPPPPGTLTRASTPWGRAWPRLGPGGGRTQACDPPAGTYSLSANVSSSCVD